MESLILKTFQSPGDVLMLTAAVRDLHLTHPGRFRTDVRSAAGALWENNPYITRLSEGDPDVRGLNMHYPAIHHSNQRPYHFIHGYVQYLEQQLGLKIPVTRFGGDIHLSDSEKMSPLVLDGVALPERFWIVIAGGKYDFTAKWWNPDSFQAVVDHFRDRIDFIQCGEAGHWHPPLEGVTGLVGKTSLRQFVRLVYLADGILCPVTFAMHLAAAVEPRPDGPLSRACVVVAGGREPAHWEAYPKHQFIGTNGALTCCAQGGCWKSRCQLVGDGDAKDHQNVCENPVQIRPDLRIARCMQMITAQDVIRRIEMYYEGGILSYRRNQTAMKTIGLTPHGNESTMPPNPTQRQKILIKFRHGLGDAVQLTSVLNNLRHQRPEWIIDVAALIGKHTAVRGLCQKAYILGQEPSNEQYDRAIDLSWDECRTCHTQWPSTKAERCLLDHFGIDPIAELCRYSIELRDEDRELVHRYFRSICGGSFGNNGRYPVVLIHYEGNTSAQYKNLGVPLVKKLCDAVLKNGAVAVILDWDFRTPLADGQRIHNPHVNLDLWRGTGTGDAAVLAAMIELSELMIGVDSGPLHVAGATSTPTIGVWTGHHPLHYFGLANNVLHLVPENHPRLLRGDVDSGNTFFNSHYRHQTYKELEPVLMAAVHRELTSSDSNLVYLRSYWIRSDNVEQDLVVVQDIHERDSYQIDQVPMPRPVVVDVGAHIGCFSKRLHQRNPLARIIAIECCPENIPALKKNVGGFATVVHGAVTYEQDVALMNAVFPGCVTTGGSTVINRKRLEEKAAAGEIAADPELPDGKQYWADFRSVPTITLEDIINDYELKRIDVLKLDCEGSEFSILGRTTSLDRIGLIVGEYHGKAKFLKLVQERFRGWDLRILKDGELGVFWLARSTKTVLQPQVKSEERVVDPASLSTQTVAGGQVRRLRSAPPILIAALRNQPKESYDLLVAYGRRVVTKYAHPRGWLRGFARLDDKLWTIDSRGIIYRVRLEQEKIRLQRISSSPLAWEAHDLTVINGGLATAGAAQNAVVIYDPGTDTWSIKRPWIASAAVWTEQIIEGRWDRYHLNSVIQDGDNLVLSIFTALPKPHDVRWRQSPLDHGMIIRWGINGFDEQPIESGIYAPHSLRIHQGRLWWCDSFRGVLCRDDGWRSPFLGGFARGLNFIGDKCLVGLSRSRVPPYPFLNTCGICICDPQTPLDKKVIELDASYIEVYDVILLEDGDFD